MGHVFYLFGIIANLRSYSYCWPGERCGPWAFCFSFCVGFPDLKLKVKCYLHNSSCKQHFIEWATTRSCSLSYFVDRNRTVSLAQCKFQWRQGKSKTFLKLFKIISKHIYMQNIFINYLKFHKYIGVKTQFPNTRKTFF